MAGRVDSRAIMEMTVCSAAGRGDYRTTSRKIEAMTTISVRQANEVRGTYVIAPDRVPTMG